MGRDRRPKLTLREMRELVRLIDVCDDEYIAGYGGDLAAIGAARQKLQTLVEIKETKNTKARRPNEE